MIEISNIFAGMRLLRHGPLRGLSSIWQALGRLYRAVVGYLPISRVASRIGNYGPFWLDPYFAFSDFARWGDQHNSGFSATIEASRGKRCIFDVGGHIGLVTLPLSRAIAPGGLVYTFEPSAANLKFLRRHLVLNDIDNVRIVEALVGVSQGEADFFEQDGPTGQNSVVVKKNQDKYHRSRKPQINLDSFVESNRLIPEVIKIDVEGAELMVLQGARKILTRYRPLLFLSVHPKELQILGSSPSELVALLEECGYICTEIDGSPVSSFKLAEYRVSPKELAHHHA